jgi:hypothetical protein
MRKWQWPWQVERVRYVPIAGDDKSYSERWSEHAYIQQVAAMGENLVWRIELAHALAELRTRADEATSPDELKGFAAGLRILRDLLTAPALARQTAADRKEIEQRMKEATGEHLG